MDHEWRFPCLLDDNYDGDTFKLTVDLGFAMRYHVAVRLDGVDTPELRGGTLLTKAAARLARDEAERFVRLAGKVVFRSTVWKGKYGRPVGDILCDGKSLAARLIASRLGVPYEGGNRRELILLHESNAAWLQGQGLLVPYGIPVAPAPEDGVV